MKFPSLNTTFLHTISLYIEKMHMPSASALIDYELHLFLMLTF